MGVTENFASVGFMKLEHGRFIVPAEIQNRRQVVVLGQTPYQSLFQNIDPIGKKVRVGTREYTVIGVLGKRPDMGGLNSNADDIVVIPYTTHEKFYGKVGVRNRTRDDRGHAARGRPARRGDARSRRVDAHPAQRPPRSSRTTSTC